MKLKKIASLALAGIMAVSMLAGCKYGEGSSNSSSSGNTVTPVDNSLAAYINGELDEKQKNVITFSSDTTVEEALKKVAATVDADDLKAGSNGSWYNGEATTAFQEALEAVAINAFQVANMDKDSTAATLLVIPTSSTEKVMKETVVTAVESLLNGASGNIGSSTTGPWLPSRSVGNDYAYDYAGKVAVTQVTSNDGKYSAYVVGVVVDLTVTEIATSQP